MDLSQRRGRQRIPCCWRCVRTPNLSVSSAGKPGTWEAEEGLRRGLLHLAGTGRGPRFQQLHHILSELPVGIPLAEGASLLPMEERVPQPGHSRTTREGREEDTLSQRQQSPTPRVTQISWPHTPRFLNFQSPCPTMPGGCVSSSLTYRRGELHMEWPDNISKPHIPSTQTTDRNQHAEHATTSIPEPVWPQHRRAVV